MTHPCVWHDSFMCVTWCVWQNTLDVRRFIFRDKSSLNIVCVYERSSWQNTLDVRRFIVRDKSSLNVQLLSYTHTLTHTHTHTTTHTNTHAHTHTWRLRVGLSAPALPMDFFTESEFGPLIFFLLGFSWFLSWFKICVTLPTQSEMCVKMCFTSIFTLHSLHPSFLFSKFALISFARCVLLIFQKNKRTLGLFWQNLIQEALYSRKKGLCDGTHGSLWVWYNTR